MTSSSETWSCRISIKWNCGADAEDWTEDHNFSVTVPDPAGLELALQRAQATVLNPSIPAKVWADMPEEALRRHREQNELQFSTHTVCVEISGPTRLDLTIVDLPGRCIPCCYEAASC